MYRAWLPEWSKGADLRSAVFARVGSNPTPGILFSIIFYLIIIQILLHKVMFIWTLYNTDIKDNGTYTPPSRCFQYRRQYTFIIT